MKNRKTNRMDEGLKLNFYPQKYGTVSLRIATEVLEALNKKAEERKMTLDALLKLYIGQSLRVDLSEKEAKALLTKKLRSRRISSRSDKNLAA